MLHQLYQPSPPLSRFISHFTYYKDFTPEHKIDRFLPDGNIEVVIDLTPTPKYIYHNESLEEIQACRKLWISGIRNTYITIPSGKDSEMFIINFRKGMVYPFLQMPLHEITDTVIDGDLILPPVFLDLREALLESRSTPEMFHRAQAMLLQAFAGYFTYDPFIEFAVGGILHAPENLTIKSLTDKSGYSSRYFIQRFREQVGVAPKAFLRIIRFQKAIQEIERGSVINWPALAYECGYFDQSHFISDFKNFSGFTPLEYLKRKNDQLNYVPVG